MSTSIGEVISAGGYDLTTLEDARWLVSLESNFDDLIEKAEELIEEAENAEEAEDES